MKRQEQTWVVDNVFFHIFLKLIVVEVVKDTEFNLKGNH